MCLPNLFPETVQLETKEIEKIGKCKTLLFIIILIVSVAAATIFYMLDETVTQVTVSKPSFSEYQKIQSKNPSCECVNSNIRMSEFASINIEREVFCGQAHVKFTRCSQDSSNAQLSGREQDIINVCTGSPAFAYLKGLDGLCSTSKDVHDLQQANFLSSSFSSIFLVSTRQKLTNQINNTYQQTINNVEAILSSSRNMIENFASLDRPVLHSVDNLPSAYKTKPAVDENRQSVYDVSIWDLAAGDQNTPVDECKCGDSWACSISLGDPNDPVVRSCSIFETIMNSPIKVWDSAPWWQDGLSLDASSMQNINNNDIFSTEGFIFESSPSFASTDFETAFLNGFVKTRELVVNYEDYYNSCAPDECIYFETRKRTLAEIITVLAGLIGGFNVVAQALVNICCASKVNKAKANAKVTPETERIPSNIEAQQYAL